ncbi:MAG: hypothetical protein U0166_02120 [Acidobacteriota bacterium]
MRLGTLAALTVAVFVFVALFGTLHVDEGHYHAAGRLVLEGKLPYRDFIYVQAPAYPYLGAALQLVTGPTFTGVRLGHAALGALSVILGGLLARRGGRLGLGLYALLVLPNLFTIYHLSFIKLYPVAALALSLAFVLFERDGPGSQVGAHVACALAVATRVSLLPALGVMAVAGLARRRAKALVPIGAACATLAIAFLPHLLLAREQLLYDMFRYHFEKDAFTTRQLVAYKLDSLSGIASHFWPALLLASATAFGSAPLHGLGEETVRRLTPWAVSLGLVTSHLVAKGPNLHLYLTAAYPYAAASLAAGAAAVLPRLGGLSRPAVLGSTLCFLVVLPAQVRETLPVGRPDPTLLGAPAHRTPLFPPTALRVDAVARDVASLTRPGDEIVSFADSVPVAARRRNLERYEMNAVSYAWDPERARRFAVLHSSELVAAIASGRVAACLVTDDSFIGNFPRFYNPGERGIRPDVMAAIEARFQLVRTYAGFGYFGRDAYLYVRRTSG